MRISQILFDTRQLIKLLKGATGMKVLRTDFNNTPFSAFNIYRGIVQEYKDEGPHITVVQGSWNCTTGGEYKVSIYTPTIVVKNQRTVNKTLLRDITKRIVEALNERFGEECWSVSGEAVHTWLPLSRCAFYIQIPNFKEEYENSK